VRIRLLARTARYCRRCVVLLFLFNFFFLLRCCCCCCCCPQTFFFYSSKFFDEVVCNNNVNNFKVDVKFGFDLARWKDEWRKCEGNVTSGIVWRRESEAPATFSSCVYISKDTAVFSHRSELKKYSQIKFRALIGWENSFFQYNTKKNNNNNNTACCCWTVEIFQTKQKNGLSSGVHFFMIGENMNRNIIHNTRTLFDTHRLLPIDSLLEMQIDAHYVTYISLPFFFLKCPPRRLQSWQKWPVGRKWMNRRWIITQSADVLGRAKQCWPLRNKNFFFFFKRGLNKRRFKGLYVYSIYCYSQ
jgi:hypothetical protein